MKTVSLLSVLVVAVCLTGCGNPELDACQQEKVALVGELEQANANIAKKENMIQTLKTKSVEDQTKAMESITIMMQKQAEKDNQIKQKLAESQQQVKDLKAQNRIQQERIENLETGIQNQKGLYDNMKKALQAVEQEKQALMKKINEIQKAAVTPTDTAAVTPTDTPAAQ